MLFVLFICGVILTLILFCYNKFIIVKSITENVVICIGFLIASFLLAWLIDKISNNWLQNIPLPKNINPPQESSSTTNISIPDIAPNLLSKLKQMSSYNVINT